MGYGGTIHKYQKILRNIVLPNQAISVFKSFFELTDYLDTFLNIRYLGGGAKGTEEGVENKYTDNWLKTFSVSLGFYLQ